MSWNTVRKKSQIGLHCVRYCFGWLELSLHICCLTQKPYWILSITYRPWHVLGSQQTTYNSVAEGNLMMRLCHRLPALLTNLTVVSKMWTGVGEACVWVSDCALVGSHIFAIWLTMTLAKWYKWHKPFPKPHTLSTHTPSHLCSPNSWHAPKAGTDYSPVCLFWLWLLLHPDRLSSGLLCAQRPMGYGLAHYTWGLLPELAEACMRRVAPPDWADVALILSTTL